MRPELAGAGNRDSRPRPACLVPAAGGGLRRAREALPKVCRRAIVSSAPAFSVSMRFFAFVVAISSRAKPCGHISTLIIDQSPDNMKRINMSHARQEYTRMKSVAPDVYDAVSALGQLAAAAGIEKDLLELVKLRASQINGCAFCVQYH